jgi:hypothetical protein
MKHWKIWQILIIAAMLALIGRYLITHQAELEKLRHISSAELLWLALIALAINIAYSLLGFIVLLELGMRRLRVLPWFEIFVISRFLNFHVPQGANVFRSVKLKKEYDFPYTKSVKQITFVSWFNLIMTLAISATVVGASDPRAQLQGVNVAGALVVMAALVIAAPFILISVLRTLKGSHEKLAWLQSKMDDLIRTMYEFLATPKLLGLIILVGLAQFSLFLLIMNAGFRSIQHPIGLQSLVILSAVMTTSRIVNIVPGNLGITESLCGLFAHLLEGTVALGIIVSGLIRIVDYIVTGLLTAVFVRSFPIRKNELDVNLK